MIALSPSGHNRQGAGVVMGSLLGLSIAQIFISQLDDQVLEFPSGIVSERFKTFHCQLNFKGCQSYAILQKNGTQFLHSLAKLKQIPQLHFSICESLVCLIVSKLSETERTPKSDAELLENQTAVEQSFKCSGTGPQSRFNWILLEVFDKDLM